MIQALIDGLLLVLQWNAFSLMLKDPELLAEATKAKIEIGYIAPEAVLKMFQDLLEQTPEVQKEMVKYIKFGS